MMLQFIRDRATGWIAWVIIVLICIPFALFGINQYFEPDQGLVVASVDDSEISYYQYRNAVQQQRQRLQQMMGGNVSQDLLDTPAMRDQALQSLIDAEAMLQGAVKTGLRVGDSQVAEAIREMALFQEAGKFSTQRYNQLLHSQGMSSEGFELDLRRSLLSDQVSAAIQRTAIVTDSEIDRAVSMRNEQRVVKTLTVNPAVLKPQEPDEEAIKAHYEANPDRYVQAEQVSIRYIELSRDEIAKSITTTDEELRAIYQQRANAGSFGLAEQRTARHILIQVPSTAASEEVAKARESIDKARQRVIDGEDFAEVAKEVSEDAGSAPLGGDLGQFGREVMDPAFEDVAFALSTGEVSEPVRSKFGWHLIEVTAIQAAKIRSFEDARIDVLNEYQFSQADEKFAELAEDLARLGFENPESLEVAAEATDLSISNSKFFNLTGERAEGVIANPRIRAAAFSPDVLEAGNNSELIEIEGERRVLLRVSERKAQRQKELDEVRDEIVSTLKFEDNAARTQALGEQLLKGLQEGKTLEELASDTSADLLAASDDKPTLKWSTTKTLTRDLPAGVPSDVAKVVFRMVTPGGADESTYEGTSLPNGGYAVVELTEVSQAPSTASEDELKVQRERLVRELQVGRGMQAMGAVRQSLRRRANVVIKEQNLRPDES